MQKKVFVVFVRCVICTAPLFGQCPEQGALWQRLNYLTTSKVTAKQQLAELLPIEDKMNGCPYKNDSTHTFLLRRIGSSYFQQGDYVKAIQYYREAIKIITENANKPLVRVKDLITSYYFLSVFYGTLNNVNEKMKALDSSIAYAMRLKVPSDIACVAALYKKVEYFFDVGDYHRCVNYAKMCEKFAMEYANHETERRNINAGRTNAESSLLWRVKALLVLQDYGQVEELLKNKLAEYKETGLENYFGTLYSQLAEVQVSKGNYEQALLFYKAALKYDQKAGYNFNCKQTLKDIGYNVYFKGFKDGDQALIYYRRALGYVNKDISRSVADIFESLNIFTLIGNVHIGKQNYDSAYHYYQLALNQIKPGVTETDILSSPPEEFVRNKKIYYLTKLMIDKADAYKEQYKHTKEKRLLQQAIDIYRVTDQLLDKIKAEQTDLESKLFWRSDTRRLFENAIEACFLQKTPGNAIYFFERSRSVLLNDQLKEQRWMGEKEILKLAELNKKILRIQRQMQTAGAALAKAQDLQTDLLRYTQDLDQLKRTIQISNPLYYQNFLDTNALSLQTIQKNILKDNQAIIEIFVGDSAAFSLLLTAKQIHLFKINKRLYDSLVNDYVNFISDAEIMNKKFDDFVNTSRSLYEIIIQRSVLPPGRVIISPDGRYFPFEALVTSHSTQPVHYFLNDHAVSYTYSIRYLLNPSLNSSVSPSEASVRNFMGVAPIHYPAAMDLPALNGSDRSLAQLQSYFHKADNFIRGNASKKNFLQEFYKYKIIQLYTHASDTSNQAEPVIYFSDSVLYLSDLIRENRPATSLIVLSACETGKGKFYKGEGVFSFNRGFAAMGIPSSITTLWSVENQSTYKLTELFYKYLAKGLPVDVALQKAKLSFINASPKEKKLPYYWAGSVLVGKTDAIETKKGVSWKIIAVVIVVVGLAAILVYKRFKNKRQIDLAT